MEPYFLLSLSVIGTILVLAFSLGVKLLLGAIGGLKEDVADVSQKVGGHGEELVRLTVTLIGPNGDNGINGEVKHLRRRLDEWDRRIGEGDRRHA